MRKFPLDACGKIRILVRMEQTLRKHLLQCAAAFEATTGDSLPAIGKRMLNDNTFFARIARGGGFTVRTYDRALRWFSENWPVGLEWPEGVPDPLADDGAALAAALSAEAATA